ncbi:unnamed protein product [Rangifer tarandus platyrhynchus]|uniref:Uncharacterized protein n=1 Tax=Rangifer tarandus platyrhynchus TaxID=3082113 RepID=A0ABN8Y2F7_RANTA|nr:unnamed protein product [Rangifer tarandus platyrhynchus]
MVRGDRLSGHLSVCPPVLGNNHVLRANVIRLVAAERDLRLVKRDPSVERFQYQLLTGSQITRCGCGSERWRGPGSSWDPP